MARWIVGFLILVGLIGSASSGKDPAPDRAEARERRSEAVLAARQAEEAARDCDPNYEGACLDPNAYDHDCEGGSGDGPEYTGTLGIVGSDIHDLDRDGDGIACDV